MPLRGWPRMIEINSHTLKIQKKYYVVPTHEESIPGFHDGLGVEKNFVGWGVGMYVLLRLWVDDPSQQKRK